MGKKNKEGKSCPAKVRASIGGQALLEGIMMRGPEMTAMAVRSPKGEIVFEQWETPKNKLPKICKLPIIRGVFNFVSSMKMGYKCLMRSAEIAIPEEELEAEKRAKEEKKAAKKNKKMQKTETSEVDSAPSTSTDESTVESKEETGNEEAIKKDEAQAESAKAEEDKGGLGALMSVIMVIASVLGVVIAVALFIMLPTYLYKWCSSVMPFLTSSNDALNSLIKSVFEGVLKIVVLVAYMALVTLMKDIRRTFKYHGAEHKTIFCYENGHELTVENVRKERRFHPRCGTSFLILMLIVSIFVSFFIDPLFILISGDVPHIAIRAFVKLLLLPITMGIGYELIKIAGKHDNIITRIISAPGMWLQHITVLEPDDDMIECAIMAFKAVIPEEDKKTTVEAKENEE